MSSTKRRRVGTRDDGTAPSAESPLPFLPFDLVLEIFARSDAATLFRCAATSKPVRHAILDTDFRRRLALLRAEAEAGDRRRSFDPALFLGLSYMFQYRWEWCRHHAIAQEERHGRRGCLSSFDADKLLSSYEPMASRGCLVVLKRHGTISAEVRVVNSLTGQVSRVWPPLWVAAMYPRTLLAVGDGGSSFQLLVAGTGLRMQVFSSENGKGEWGDVVEPRLPPNFFRTVPNHCSPALVLRGTVVHWLCRDKGIIALDVGAARATAIELPPLCFGQVKRVKGADCGILVPSVDGRLSLLVAEFTVISMWTLSASASELLAGTSSAATRWSRQVVIQSQAIGRGDFIGRTVRFVRFGERSGTVTLHIEQGGLVRFNLRSREALVVSDKCTEIGTCSFSRLQLCLHETDLPTLMKNMKPF
ncbi:hypothetical protein EJB05_04244, partial [Eragrostis curvula]